MMSFLSQPNDDESGVKNVSGAMEVPSLVSSNGQISSNGSLSNRYNRDDVSCGFKLSYCFINFVPMFRMLLEVVHL